MTLKEFPNFVIFQTETGKVNIDVFFQNETLWLTQKGLAELYETSPQNITQHLKNIFLDKELDEEATCKDFLQVQIEGQREVNRQKKYYSLRAIVAVGYRVNSHWAIQGKTAAEIIYSTADAKKVYMGLKTWKNAPGGKVLKSDVSIAKNYLEEAHLKELERIVSAYLDLAENRAKRGIVMNMQDWTVFLDRFLELSDYPILVDKGKVSALEAKLKAEGQYDTYRVIQDNNYISDFDRVIAKLEGKDE